MATSRCCRRDEEADTCSQLLRSPKTPRESVQARRLPPQHTPPQKLQAVRADQANPVLDSVRVRLTLWYTGVLALVLILVAVVTYLFYARDIYQRIDSGLLELSSAFTTTFHAELADQTNPDAVKGAAR